MPDYRIHFANHPALGYDAVFYPARAFPTTHPEHLAATLTLLSLRAPPIDACRVLEIGCATGGNLLPMAESMPGAKFVGIDLSNGQIEAARVSALKLGLKNIEFRCQDLCDFGQRFPGPGHAKSVSAPETFDYIIAHGVYSWVPIDTRVKLLSLCSRHLSPGGVAFISYNTLPGWHVQSVIRELMFAHIWGAGLEPGKEPPTTPWEVAVKAREVLDSLSAAETQDAPFAALLKETASLLRGLPDASLLHDHLCPINEPVYFSRFMSESMACGLRYLGDARPHFSNPPGAVDLNIVPGDKPAPTLARIAPRPAHLELFLDAWGNRPFRQSLLCRVDAPPTPLDASATASPFSPDARHMRGLLVGSPLKPVVPEEPEFGTPQPATFIAPGGATATIAEPLARSAISCLADAWPARVTFPDLLEAAWRRMGLAGGAPGSDIGADRLASALLDGHLADLIEFSVRPARCVSRLSRRPVARPLARLQAESDDTVTTLRHANLHLNATARHLLRMLDGSRDFAALCSAMERIIVDNARNTAPDLTLSDAERKQVAKGLEQDLRKFLDEGLLVG